MHIRNYTIGVVLVYLIVWFQVQFGKYVRVSFSDDQNVCLLVSIANRNSTEYFPILNITPLQICQHLAQINKFM